MRLVIAACSLLVLLVPASPAQPHEAAPEGCQAYNPGQPSCSFKVTHQSGTPISGYAAVGTWVIKIKAGGKTTTIESSSPAPTASVSAWPKGARITASATAAGSFVIIGHVDQ